MKQSQTTGLGAAENTRMITVYCNYIRIDISTHLIQLPIRSPTWRKPDYRNLTIDSRVFVVEEISDYPRNSQSVAG